MAEGGPGGQYLSRRPARRPDEYLMDRIDIGSGRD